MRAERAAAPTLADLAWTFVRIASTSFGGYMAMISVIQQVVVERRKLLASQDVLDGVALASALPGPIALNVAAYVGYRLRGARGAAVCLAAAVLPAFALMVAFSAAYARWGQAPEVGRVFMGLLPAVAAVMVSAAWQLGAKALPGRREAALAAGAAVTLLCTNAWYATLLLIAASALLGRYWLPAGPAAAAGATTEPAREAAPAAVKLPLLFCPPQLLEACLAPPAQLLLQLFLTFAGMSLLLFGGSYVFVPLLQHAAVDAHGWVSRREFADAVALAQLMPGPAVVSVAFVGYKVAGVAGAAAATAGMLLPPAVLLVLCAGLLERVKSSAALGAALRGVRAGVVGMVAAAAVYIGRAAPAGAASLLIFALALACLRRYRSDPIWVVPPAGLLGLLVY
ncbi:chromate efflux transporter [Pseudoduganella namucuonensis]|uniref:Chromate transporter n=1 Tax=Pseudoduganella namucuonensis TaxID=1035707 RepID=A0A1I7M208_9BURK|nr:chromate efflux transporter [Pseudoduganella namucuonensis]SFV15850.1 chromate transporter [Pseudoduganella namucuonensis]